MRTEGLRVTKADIKQKTKPKKTITVEVNKNTKS